MGHPLTFYAERGSSLGSGGYFKLYLSIDGGDIYFISQGGLYKADWFLVVKVGSFPLEVLMGFHPDKDVEIPRWSATFTHITFTWNT